MKSVLMIRPETEFGVAPGSSGPVTPLGSKSPKPHRKKTLPVPGDVFVGSDGLMRIITVDGYEAQQDRNRGYWENVLDVCYHGVWFHLHTWEELATKYETTPETFIQNWERQGFYYLGNALTDEWENG